MEDLFRKIFIKNIFTEKNYATRPNRWFSDINITDELINAYSYYMIKDKWIKNISELENFNADIEYDYEDKEIIFYYMHKDGLELCIVFDPNMKFKGIKEP